MPEIKQVNAIQANPSPSDPNGRVTAGHYILEDGLLTMVDADGKPLRGTGGEKIVHRMQDGENPDSIACRLTLMLYRRADDGFNRPLNFQPNQHWH